jgi:cobalamin biosynthesis protein CobT
MIWAYERMTAADRTNETNKALVIVTDGRSPSCADSQNASDNWYFLTPHLEAVAKRIEERGDIQLSAAILRYHRSSSESDVYSHAVEIEPKAPKIALGLVDTALSALERGRVLRQAQALAPAL